MVSRSDKAGIVLKLETEMPDFDVEGFVSLASESCFLNWAIVRCRLSRRCVIALAQVE